MDDAELLKIYEVLASACDAGEVDLDDDEAISDFISVHSLSNIVDEFEVQNEKIINAFDLKLLQKLTIVSPLQEGRMPENLIKLLRSDKEISQEIRVALADYLGDLPQMKKRAGEGKGRPSENILVRKRRATQIGIQFVIRRLKGCTVEKSIDEIGQIKGCEIGSSQIKGIIYSKKGNSEFIVEQPIIQKLVWDIIPRGN